MRSYDSGCCFRGSSISHSVRVLWELNTRCNLSCSWCHTKNNARSQLPTSEVFNGLNLIRQWGINGVIFSGGEPLLRSDLVDIVKMAFSIGFEVDLCTNATLVNSHIASQLGKYLSELSVSLDSGVPEIHDRIRGTKGALKKTVNGIKCLIGAGIEVHAITMCCDDNIATIEETIQLLDQLKVHSVTLLGLISIEGVKTPYILSEGKRYALVQSLPAYRSKYPDIIINTKRIMSFEDAESCGAGKTILGVDTTGALLPCILQRENVRSIPLFDLKDIISLEDVLIKFNQSGNDYWKTCLKRGQP